MRGGATRRRRQPTQQQLWTSLEHLPHDVIKEIGKYHRQLIPPFTNDRLRRAVQDYLAGGARKQRIVEKYGDISHWDTSKVTNMNRVFYRAQSFNQPLNNWNVSNVTNMYGMFWNATAFNQPLNHWNVSNVTNMGRMFWNATAFNQPLNHWNVSNVTDMDFMFA